MAMQQHHLHRRLLAIQIAAEPPANTGSRGSSSSSYANFDSNMMVILAALLLALLCAIGLNSIVRCARRCSQRFATESPDGAAAAAMRLASTGLSKDALSRIPVVAYESGLEIIPAKECCPICLGEFGGGEKVRVLPKCSHGFHVKCIDPWLVSHSSCPNCRVTVI